MRFCFLFLFLSTIVYSHPLDNSSTNESENNTDQELIEFIEGMPLFPTPTNCKTPDPGVVMVYLPQEGREINGQRSRSFPGILHFCQEDGACFFCGVLGEGYKQTISSNSNGDTPVMLAEAYPDAESGPYRKKDEFGKNRWAESVPLDLRIRAGLKGIIEGRDDFAHHERTDDVSPDIFRDNKTAGCLKTMRNYLSDSTDVCLQKINEHYQARKKTLQRNAQDSDQLGFLEKARNYLDELSLKVFKKLLPGKEITTELPTDHKDYLGKLDRPIVEGASSGQDVYDNIWREEKYYSLRYLITEHLELSFDRGTSTLELKNEQGEVVPVCYRNDS